MRARGGRRCGKAAVMRWLLLDHVIDESASEREGRDSGRRRGKKTALMKRPFAVPQDTTKSIA